MTNHTEAGASEATLRMAKTLGTEFVHDPKWSEAEANTLADEPVAWMYEHPSDGIYVSPVKRHLHPGWTETPLYAAPPASVDRNAVLEEAAKVVEDMNVVLPLEEKNFFIAESIAAIIRAKAGEER